MARKVRRLLWTLVVCVLLLLGVKTFVGDVYRISSSSMEPWGRPDEWVFVRYDHSRPERFEPVVVEHHGETLVKRACALGGESVLIDSAGDLKIDGAYVPLAQGRPDPILIFDSGRLPVSENFARGDSQGDPWTELPGDVLELDARELELGRATGLLRYHKSLRDHYLDRHGELVPGSVEVHDGVVGFEFRAPQAGGRLRVGLVEQGDTFEFVVELSQPGTAQAWLTRTTPEGTETLVQGLVPFELQTWTFVRFSNIDNHLSADWGEGPPVLEASYEFNTLHPLDNLKEGRSFGARVLVGGEGCLLRFRALRVWRDLHWTQRGQYGVGRRYDVEPGKVFLLGDNSSDSLDSREFGAVERIRGRPVLVVWPPEAMRWIGR